MPINLTIKQCLEALGYKPYSGLTVDKINEWINWYQGYDDSFHQYRINNGIKNTTLRRAHLDMAKTVCEDWANLLLNEKVLITSDEASDEVLKSVFADNEFEMRANQLIEITMALGTGAFVEFKQRDRVVIDYIRADMIFPLSWENGVIKEVAFGSRCQMNGQATVYLQIHVLKSKEDPTYLIKNYYIDAETGKEFEGANGIESVVDTKSIKPLFQIITPNIKNNIDLDSPMGISVYANAIDVLKGCDLVYDSLCNEFKLGKKRIFVPTSLAKIKMTADGDAAAIFDTNDTVFHAYQGSEDKGITETNGQLRIEAHTAGLNKNLDVLSFKCGLGKDRYRFERAGVKTATEVISEDSDLYRNLCKHEKVLETALRNLCSRVLFLTSGTEPNVEINIDFDDSIIQDTDTERKNDREDLANGTLRAEEYRAKWRNETLEEALENLPEAAMIME